MSLRILHVLDHSIPLHSGYTFRTLSILREQRKLGWETFHLTTPKQGQAQQTGHRLVRVQEELGSCTQATHYEYCLYKRDAIPQNNPSNAKYKPMIEPWRRMPIGLATSLGPFIVRKLG